MKGKCKTFFVQLKKFHHLSALERANKGEKFFVLRSQKWWWEAGHVHGWAGKEYSESSSYQVEANFVGTGLWKDYVQSEPEK